MFLVRHSLKRTFKIHHSLFLVRHSYLYLMFLRSLQLYPALVLLALLMAGCASPKSPTGGEPDKTPPKIIESESTPNEQVNFTGNEITILFDEWVTLKDVYSQLVVSPIMPQEPEIKQRGKAIVISLPDSLRENTTYTINFGNAIQDLHEGNILENFVFVFSTGPVLDSIRLTGQVFDAITLKPVPGAWVMLYPMGEDSAVYKRKPDYVSKTNTEGAWSMSYLRSDIFHVIALKDENANLIYDQDTELIAFLGTPVNTDSLSGELAPIFLFPKEKTIGVSEVIPVSKGWLKIVVSGPEPKPYPSFTPLIDTIATRWEGDTLNIWFDADSTFAGRVIVDTDTTTIRASAPKSLLTTKMKLAQTRSQIHPTGVASYKTDLPIKAIDTSRIDIELDSSGAFPFTMDRSPTDRRVFSINMPWKPGKRYGITFLPGAITDIWDRQNDTVRHSLIVNSTDQFGDLTMSIEGLDSVHQYVVSLKDGQNLIDTFVVVDQSQVQIKKNALSPAKYIIEIVEDRNRNGRWDTGEYSVRRSPEPRMTFTTDVLRAGWELEAKMIWKPGSTSN